MKKKVSRILFIVLAFVCVSMFVFYCVNATVFTKHLVYYKLPSASVPSAKDEQTVNGIVGKLNNSLENAKLSQWELLLVNAENKLPDEYEFTPAYMDEESLDERIYDSLNSMLKAAGQQGLSLWVASAYRGVETQKVILKNEIEIDMGRYDMTETEARENALKTIAEPGYSEHHTGLAVDFNYVNDAFKDTQEYKWLSENAAEYGFVQRFPSDKEEKTGISVEPWHYRYVGKENAKVMNKLGFCLEEYIEYLKEN